MSKPTPGPYFVQFPPSEYSPDLHLLAEYSPEERSKYPESDGKWLGIVRRYRTADEQAATAALLAAAPDLLDACRAAAQLFLDLEGVEIELHAHDEISAVAALAAQAIRKAEGERHEP